MCFFEGGGLKAQLSWSLKGVELEMTLLFRCRSRKCEVLIVFSVERPSEEGAP